MLLTIMVILSALFGVFTLSKVVPVSIRMLNFVSYQYLLHFILLVVPGTIMILNGNRDDLALIPVSDSAVLKTALFVIWCILIFPISLYFFDIIYRGRMKAKIEEYKYRKTLVSFSRVRTINIFFISVFNSFLLLFFLYLLPIIPILHIGSGSEFIMNARLESAFDLPSFLYGFRRILVYYLPIFFLYVLAFHYGVKKVNLFILWLCFFNTIIILGYSTEKAPVVFFLFSIFYLKNIVLPSFKMSGLIFLLLIISIIMLILGMFYIFYDGNFLQAIESLRNRILVSQIAGSFLAVEHYGNIADFKYFSSVFFRIYDLLGEKVSLSPSEELVQYYYRELFDNNLWRNTNSFIIQGAWANFGWIGIIIAPIWCAFLFYFFMMFFLNSPKKPENIAIYSYSTIFMFSLSTNFNNFIYSSGFLLTLFIWLFLRKI